MADAMEHAARIAAEATALQKLLSSQTDTLEELATWCDSRPEGYGTFFDVAWMPGTIGWRVTVYLDKAYTHPEIGGANTIRTTGDTLPEALRAMFDLLPAVTKKED